MFPTVHLLMPVTEEYKERKRALGKCVTYRCKRQKQPDRLRCSTCNCRLHRLRHPDHYAFVALKASARKRGIAFQLTFSEFLEFCEDNDYLTRKGTEPESLTIDREFTDLPYRMGNLRIMTHRDNSSHRYEKRFFGGTRTPDTTSRDDSRAGPMASTG